MCYPDDAIRLREPPRLAFCVDSCLNNVMVRPSLAPSFFIKSRGKEYGIVVHGQCWTLIKRPLGSHVGNNSQWLPFFRACVAVWKVNILDFDICYTHEGRVKLFQRREGSQTKYWGRDPVDILPIKDLLKTSISRAARRKTRKETRRRAAFHGRTIHRERMDMRVSPEIQLLILDFVHSRNDAQNLLIAFGWLIPEEYWRRRSPREVIFEVEDLDQEDDWMFLCLEGGPSHGDVRQFNESPTYTAVYKYHKGILSGIWRFTKRCSSFIRLDGFACYWETELFHLSFARRHERCRIGIR